MITTKVLTVAISLLASVALAVPCPVETPIFGGIDLTKLNQNSDSIVEEYFVVDDDDFTRITEFRVCLCCLDDQGVHEHFRGFSVTIFSPMTGYSTKSFGAMDADDPDTLCTAHDMSQEELVGMEMYADINDVEGIVWWGHKGTKWVSRANGNVASPMYKMKGRPIGFRVWMGIGGMPNQPLQLKIVYNSCNCPASAFSGDEPLPDMEITAVIGTTQTQTLPYLTNNIEKVYEQDCGGYSISHAPELPFFSIQTSGTSLDSRGLPYPDLATLSPVTLDEVGLYEVSVLSSQDLNDSNQGFYTPYRGKFPDLEQVMILKVHPCPVTDLVSTQFQSDIYYKIGDPEITVSGLYAFEDQPNQCGYVQTDEIISTSTVFTYDDVKREFIIPQTFDSSHVGEHLITIRSTIQVWDDYTKTSFTEYEATQDFKIFVEPCIVDTLTLMNQVSDISYVIGDSAGASTSAYSFEQSPSICNSPVDLKVTSTLLLFLSHNQDGQVFEVPYTDDLTHEGTYEITVSAEIVSWTDYTKTASTTASQEFQFTIEMINPCRTTTFSEALQIEDMEQFVMYPAMTKKIKFNSDSASLAYGDKSGLSLCGDRIFEVTTDPVIYSAFLSQNSLTNEFTVVTENVDDVGSYTLEARIYLQDYPEIETQASFTVVINHCKVTNMLSTQVPPQSYQIRGPAVSFDLNFFTFEPNVCDYNLSYEIEFFDQNNASLSPLPSWITVVTNPDSFTFSVETSDLTLLGNYEIIIVGTLPDEFAFPWQYSEKYTQIDLDLVNKCDDDELTPLEAVGDQLYYINDDGTLDLQPSWTSKHSGCTYNYGIKRIENGIERPLTTDEKSVISISPEDGTTSIDTSDFSLDGQVWTICVFKDSLESKNVNKIGEYVFQVEFKDACWESELIEAQFQESLYSYTLYELQEMVYTEMSSNRDPALCGGFSSSLEYVSGPALMAGQDPSTVSMPNYTFQSQPDGISTAIQGCCDMKAWTGTNFIRIKSILGAYDSSLGARGDKGIFKTVYSEPIELTITDPCVDSVVSQLEPEISELAVPERQSSIVQVINGPTDSISLLYGNGFGLCGPLSYELKDLDGRPFSFELFSQKVERKTTTADVIQWELRSAPTGLLQVVSFTVEMKLKDYPSSTPATFQIDLLYRDCIPDSFRGPTLHKHYLTVGDPVTTIDFFFDQSPCVYNQAYTVEAIDPRQGNRVKLPAFVSLIGEQLMFSQTFDQDVGEYRIKVCSKLENSFQSTTCSLLDLEVMPFDDGSNDSTEEEVKPEEPEKEWPAEFGFSLDLVDISVRVGASATYTLGELKGANLKNVTMTVDDDAAQFTSFNETSFTFNFDGKLVTEEDIGSYKVKILVVFDDETLANLTASFNLNIVEDPDIETKSIPDGALLYEEWPDHRFVRKNSTQQDDDDSERPIPYIIDLSADGVLQIGWNQAMQPPSDYSEIPPTLIAVEHGLQLNELQFWETRGRELRQSYESFEPYRESQPEVVYFTDKETDSFEMMKLVDALEVLVTPADPEESQAVKFTWTVTDYSEDQIRIQIRFEDPKKVSAEASLDILSVTFWGVEYFKSAQDKEVKVGTTLYWPIQRQISQDDVESVNLVNDTVVVFTAFALVFLLPVVAAGSLLPTWMFINALQIIAHLTLISAMMPANVHYLLKKYLDLLRWHDDDMSRDLDESYDFKWYPIGTGSYNTLMQTSGYRPLFAQNMIIVLAVLGLMLVILVACTCLDCVITHGKCLDQQKNTITKTRLERDKSEKRYAPWCKNFILRFLYEFFLEFCICALLQVTIVEAKSTFQYGLAVFTLCLITALLIFTCSRFWCKGPWVSGFFAKGTSGGSLYRMRVRDPNFEAEMWLKDNAVAPVRPWGSKLVGMDCSKLFCQRKNDSIEKSSNLKTQNTDEGGLWSERKLIESPADSERGIESSQAKLPGVGSHKRGISDLPLLYEGGQVEEKEIDDAIPQSRNQPDLFKQEWYSWQFRQLQTKRGSLTEKLAAKRLLKDKMGKEARLRLRVEQTLRPKEGHKTLFFGLKLNHERNVAIVHPLIFLLRRVIYALAIVFLAEISIFGLLAVMLSGLVVLAYALNEQPWTEKLTNKQHVVNEICIYVCCVILMICNGYVQQTSMRHLLGYSMIGVICVLVAFNSVSITIYSMRLLKKYLLRILVQSRRLKVQNEALELIKKLNSDPWFEPESVVSSANQEPNSQTNSCVNHQEQNFVPKVSQAGGIRVLLISTQIEKREVTSQNSDESLSDGVIESQVPNEMTCEERKSQILLELVQDTETLPEEFPQPSEGLLQVNDNLDRTPLRGKEIDTHPQTASRLYFNQNDEPNGGKDGRREQSSMDIIKFQISASRFDKNDSALRLKNKSLLDEKVAQEGIELASALNGPGDGDLDKEDGDEVDKEPTDGADEMDNDLNGQNEDDGDDQLKENDDSNSNSAESEKTEKVYPNLDQQVEMPQDEPPQSDILCQAIKAGKLDEDDIMIQGANPKNLLLLRKEVKQQGKDENQKSRNRSRKKGHNKENKTTIRRSKFDMNKVKPYLMTGLEGMSEPKNPTIQKSIVKTMLTKLNKPVKHRPSLNSLDNCYDQTGPVTNRNHHGGSSLTAMVQDREQSNSSFATMAQHTLDQQKTIDLPSNEFAVRVMASGNFTAERNQKSMLPNTITRNDTMDFTQQKRIRRGGPVSIDPGSAKSSLEHSEGRSSIGRPSFNKTLEEGGKSQLFNISNNAGANHKKFKPTGDTINAKKLANAPKWAKNAKKQQLHLQPSASRNKSNGRAKKALKGLRDSSLEDNQLYQIQNQTTDQGMTSRNHAKQARLLQANSIESANAAQSTIFFNQRYKNAKKDSSLLFGVSGGGTSVSKEQEWNPIQRPSVQMIMKREVSRGRLGVFSRKLSIWPIGEIDYERK